MPSINGPKGSINATGLYNVGNASDMVVGMIGLMIHVVNAGTISIVVKSRVASQAAGDDNVTPVPVLYVSRYLNGAISTDGLLSTAITGESLILVPASAQDIFLDVTYTSGNYVVYKLPVGGATA